MRLLKDQRGVARVIEALLASILLMSCLVLIPSLPILNDSTPNMASTAQNILLSLDGNGHLAALVDARDWNGLKDSIASVLPLTSWFNLTVFDKNMNCLNTYPICSSGAVSGNVASVDYVCASQNGTYALYVLRLQLSEVGLS